MKKYLKENQFYILFFLLALYYLIVMVRACGSGSLFEPMTGGWN